MASLSMYTHLLQIYICNLSNQHPDCFVPWRQTTSWAFEFKTSKPTTRIVVLTSDTVFAVLKELKRLASTRVNISYNKNNMLTNNLAYEASMCNESHIVCYCCVSVYIAADKVAPYIT